MLGAIAGAEALEIVVLLKDLSEKGLKNLEKNLASVGKTGKASSSSLAGGFLGIPTPLAAAGVAIAGVAALAASTIPVYEKVTQQEKQLAIAFKGHGESLDALRPKIEEAIKVGEGYAYNADETRTAIIHLTEAGLSFAEIQTALPHIMDLARAKNIDLGEATDSYTKAVYGNARALKQYGIILPAVTASSADVGKATSGVTKAQGALKLAQEQLIVVEDRLKGKHHLTAAEALQLKTAHDRVTTAQNNLKAAQQKLTLAQQGGVDKAARLTLVNNGLNKAIGNQRGTATDLQKAQARLNDAWERFSTVIAPVLLKALTLIIDALATIVDWVSRAIGALTSLNTKSNIVVNNTQGHFMFTGKGAAFIPGRASGGPVLPGGVYTVGEAGPETLVMGAAGGMVIPHAGGGGGTVVTIVQLDGREIARQVDRYLHRSIGMAGTGIRRPMGG